MKLMRIKRLEDFEAPVKQVPAPVIEAVEDPVEDNSDVVMKHEMRAFAHNQLAKSHPGVHKKYNCYD